MTKLRKGIFRISLKAKRFVTLTLISEALDVSKSIAKAANIVVRQELHGFASHELFVYVSHILLNIVLWERFCIFFF